MWLPVQESSKLGIHLEQLLPGGWSCLEKFAIHFQLLSHCQSPGHRGTAHQNRSSARWQNTHRCWSLSSCPHSPNPINCAIYLLQWNSAVLIIQHCQKRHLYYIFALKVSFTQGCCKTGKDSIEMVKWAGLSEKASQYLSAYAFSLDTWHMQIPVGICICKAGI